MPALPGVSQLLRLPETDSTQAVARFLAGQGAPHGTLVWADRQTAGRGRMDRAWESADGGLYFSLILRPDASPKVLAKLSVACAEAVASALGRRTGLETRVKKPNDVLAFKDGRGGKVCGILIEASGGQRRVDWVVVGVGVNVNNSVSLETAASIKGLTGRATKLEPLLIAVLAALQMRYNRAFTYG